MRLLFVICIFLFLGLSNGKKYKRTHTEIHHPGVEIKFVLSAKELPNMGLTGIGSPDPYVELFYYRSPDDPDETDEPTTKTVAISNDHNPVWEELFQVTYIENHSQRIRFNVKDKDVVGKDKDIGTVTISLKELFDSNGKKMVYDIISKKIKGGQLIIYAKIGNQLSDESPERLIKGEHPIKLRRMVMTNDK